MLDDHEDNFAIVFAAMGVGSLKNSYFFGGEDDGGTHIYRRILLKTLSVVLYMPYQCQNELFFC